MKQADLRPCRRCGKGLMHAGVPLFYRLSIETMGVDLNAVRRQVGLEMMLGGSAMLAHAMGPDVDLAAPLGPPVDLLICQSCALDPGFIFAELLEPAS